MLSLGPTKEVAMHAGNIRTEQQANCVLVFALLLEQDIIPLLQQQKGFQDKIIPIAGKRNEAIVIVYRVSEENADAYNHVLYLDALRTLSRVVESVPVVEPFEVVDSRFNGTAAGAA